MIKTCIHLLLSGAALALSSCSSPAPEAMQSAAQTTAQNGGLYALNATTLEGQPADLSAYRGQVALVVNTASKCGYTPQYEGLEQIYQEFKDRGLVVLGFPSGDFGNQEFGDAAQIREFCTSKYQVSFPLFAKSVTKAQPDQSPVFAYLGGATGSLPSWNFGKYLVGRDGQAIAFFPHSVKPSSAELRQAIEAALAKPG
jgi:glutathione peroxidase